MACCSAPKTLDVCVRALGEPRWSAFKYFLPVCPAAVSSQPVTTSGPLFSLWVDLSAVITSDFCQKYISFPDLADYSTHSHRVWCAWIWPLTPGRCRISSLWVVSIERAGESRQGKSSNKCCSIVNLMRSQRQSKAVYMMKVYWFTVMMNERLVICLKLKFGSTSVYSTVILNSH